MRLAYSYIHQARTEARAAPPFSLPYFAMAALNPASCVTLSSPPEDGGAARRNDGDTPRFRVCRRIAYTVVAEFHSVWKPILHRLETQVRRGCFPGKPPGGCKSGNAVYFYPRIGSRAPALLSGRVDAGSVRGNGDGSFSGVGVALAV